MEFDTSLYYVDHLATGDVSSYIRLDVRLCGQPTKALDMNIGVKDYLMINTFNSLELMRLIKSNRN